MLRRSRRRSEKPCASARDWRFFLVGVQTTKWNDEKEREVYLDIRVSMLEYDGVGGMRTLTMTPKTISGNMAIFCMPMIHTPSSLMYVMRLFCFENCCDRRSVDIQDEVHDHKDGVGH